MCALIDFSVATLLLKFQIEFKSQHYHEKKHPSTTADSYGHFSTDSFLSAWSASQSSHFQYKLSETC